MSKKKRSPEIKIPLIDDGRQELSTVEKERLIFTMFMMFIGILLMTSSQTELPTFVYDDLSSETLYEIKSIVMFLGALISGVGAVSSLITTYHEPANDDKKPPPDPPDFGGFSW